MSYMTSIHFLIVLITVSLNAIYVAAATLYERYDGSYGSCKGSNHPYSYDFERWLLGLMIIGG